MKKSILLCMIAFLSSSTSAEAQFFKKLTEKVTNKVEDVVTSNISDKAAKEADDALNNVWEMDLKGMDLGMGSPIDPAEIPNSYTFDWKYTMNINAKNDGMEFVYRLKEDAPYMGMEFPKMENMFIVLDNEKEMTVMYMGNTVRATKMETDPTGEMGKENPYADMEYEKIGSKTILGYECDGYRAETDDYVFTMYITDEAGVGFSSMYQNQKNIPKGFDPDWISEDSLLMEMQMDNKKDSEKSMTMTCTSIEQENFTITK